MNDNETGSNERNNGLAHESYKPASSSSQYHVQRQREAILQNATGSVTTLIFPFIISVAVDSKRAFAQDLLWYNASHDLPSQ